MFESVIKHYHQEKKRLEAQDIEIQHKMESASETLNQSLVMGLNGVHTNSESFHFASKLATHRYRNETTAITSIHLSNLDQCMDQLT